MIRIYSLLFILILNFTAEASFVFSDNCRKAYAEIFNLDFREAEYYIKIEELYNPSNPSVIFLKSGIHFMQAVLTENKTSVNNFFELHNELLSNLNNKKENTELTNWLISETNFHAALLHFKTAHYLKGAWKLHQSYKVASANENEKSILFYKVSGLTESFLSTVPDEYHWVLKIFGMNGDLNGGLNKLKKLFNTGKMDNSLEFILQETLFYIAYIEGNLINDKEKALFFIDNHNNINGIFTQYIKASLLLKSGKSVEAEKILNETNFYQRKLNSPFPFLIYLNGLAKLYQLDYTAESFFKEYINIYKGNHYIKSAYQKIAWINLLKENKENYNYNINKIISEGTDDTDQDKQALKEAKSKEILNIQLLKTRLLFDGGNYAEANEQLKAVDYNLLNKKEKVEFKYRAGRIFQEQQNESSAEAAFIETINLQGSENYYFAPNAALQLALMAETNKDFKKAELYFKKAYSYKKHDYKNSIQQKAKAGLRRIGAV